MEKLPVFYPMGAVGFKEGKHESLWNDPNWVAERKYDGFRYMIKKENGKVSVLSRNPSVETGLPVDKTANVPHLVEVIQEMIPDGAVIDGEIITHENCESHEVTRIMGCDPEKAIARQEEEGWVKFVAFDIIYWKGVDLTRFYYFERRQAIERIYKNHLSHSKHFLLAPVYKVDKEGHYEAIVKGGGEGVILKNQMGKYEITLDPKKVKKPKDTWVKVKKYKTFDVVIMGFTEPTMEYSGKDISTWQLWHHPTEGGFTVKENTPHTTLQEQGYIPVTKPFWNGWCGAVEFGQYKNGELVKIGDTSGISDDTKHMFSHSPQQYIGKVMEVGAMRQNKKSGALVHPRFIHMRPDKLPEQCILGEE